MNGFKVIVWDSEPAEFENLKDGKCRVNVSVEKVTHTAEDGREVVQYKSLSKVMAGAEVAAYLGAKSVAARRENEIIDETILNLIEEGSL